MPPTPLTVVVVLCVTIWVLIYLTHTLIPGSETLRRSLSRIGTAPDGMIRALVYGTYLAASVMVAIGLVVGSLHPVVAVLAVVTVVLSGLDLSRRPV